GPDVRPRQEAKEISGAPCDEGAQVVQSYFIMTMPPTQRNLTCVAYARVSSKDQAAEGFSIPAQLELLRSYAAKNGFMTAQEFVDVETAKAAGRTGFGEMIDFLKQNADCRTILVEKTDRLYRNLRDAVTIEDLGVEVHFVKENQVLSPASRSSDKFMHGIQVLMARNYVLNLGE